MKGGLLRIVVGEGGSGRNRRGGDLPQVTGNGGWGVLEVRRRQWELEHARRNLLEKCGVELGWSSK